MYGVLSLGVLLVFLTSSAVAMRIVNDDLNKREECKDIKSSFACISWKNDCTSGPWMDWMAKNCKKTCNKCSTGQVAPKPPSVKGKCKDLKSSHVCKFWKNDCTSGPWMDWMAKNCKKTCNQCSTGQVVTKPPSVKGKCEKEDDFGCQQWEKEGLCKQQVYLQFMKSNCPAACGLCQAVELKAEPVTVNIQECLQAHNSYRAQHGAPPLTWDSKMAKEAQAYAMVIAKVHKKLKHAQGISDGENLAYQGGAKLTCKEATKRWYDEVEMYKYDNPGFSKATGHFTQVVWKSTKRLGVGIARYGHKYYVVARYSPPGNYGGMYRQNVGPKV